MTMHLAPEYTITCDAQLAWPDMPVVVEFTSSRVRQRPLAARPGGIELAAARLPVRAVDIDAYPDLRRRFKITLLPTFVVLHDSAELARFVGPHSRRELAGAIRRALDPSMVVIQEPPRARGLWNDFSTRLWGFTSG
jgi:thioredoxin-like negative regulator of GroEL